MRNSKLNRQEREIEEALLKDEYLDVSKHDYAEIAQAVSSRRKDAVLNIRVNSQDLKNIKDKARRMGIKYQTFISELLHRVAHN